MKSLCLSLFILTIAFRADGQFLNKLKRAAERGVENAVERQVEKGVQKATERQIEKALSNLYTEEDLNDENGKPRDFSGLMKGLKFDVETADKYAFTGSANMLITGTDSKGRPNDPFQAKSFLSSDATYSGLRMEDDKNQAENAIMIVDYERGASILFMESDGEKSSIAFAFDFDVADFESFADSSIHQSPEVSIKKTGKSEKIAGVMCDEYHFESDEYNSYYWMSREDLPGVYALWSKNSGFLKKKIKKENEALFNKIPDGQVMKMVYEDKEDKTTMNMEITSIETDKEYIFEMSEYPNAYASK